MKYRRENKPKQGKSQCKHQCEYELCRPPVYCGEPRKTKERKGKARGEGAPYLYGGISAGDYKKKTGEFLGPQKWSAEKTENKDAWEVVLGNMH